MEKQKNCQVCGRGNALKNFGAITCLPCAAFFRRTIALALEFECICDKYRENQIVKNKNDSNSAYKVRLFGCKGCRLKRCFEAGMEKDKVQAIKIRYLLKQRQNEQMLPLNTVKTGFPAESLQNDENGEVMKNLMQIGERISLIWHSSVSLPTEFWDTTLEQLLNSQDNLLARYEEFSAKSKIKFNKNEYLEKVAKCGLPDNWLDCQSQILKIRGVLILIGMLTALQPFAQLDIRDQMLQVKGTIEVANHLMLALESLKQSSEQMIVPIGFGHFEIWQAMKKFYGSDILEQRSYNIFVKPMSMFVNLNLDKLESTLLIYILLCTPTASSSLSSEASEILHAESEKFVKLLLRFQQHRFGEQAGALRYMESQRLIWNTIGRVQKYHELITYFDIVLNNGVLDSYSPKIMKSMC